MIAIPVYIDPRVIEAQERAARAEQLSTPFRFLDLPPELRLRIYELAFPHQTISLQITCSVRVRDTQPPVNLALLRTCRQVYVEAKPVVYGRTIFDIRLSDSLHTGRFKRKLCWLDEISLEGLHSVYLRGPKKCPGWEKLSDFPGKAKIALAQMQAKGYAKRLHLEVHNVSPDCVNIFQGLRCESRITMCLVKHVPSRFPLPRKEIISSERPETFLTLADQLGA